MSNITPYFANNWISKLNTYENGGWSFLLALTGIEADLLPSPGHRSCRFPTLSMYSLGDAPGAEYCVLTAVGSEEAGNMMAADSGWCQVR